MIDPAKFYAFVYSVLEDRFANCLCSLQTAILGHLAPD
jgi:hypothetical protein